MAGGYSAHLVEPTVPFDRAGLWRMVDEIRGYLAELRYIDAVHEYVHFPERLRDTNPRPPYLGGPTFHDTIPMDLRVRLGTTFPAEVAITYTYPVTPEHIERLLARLQLGAELWAADNVTTLTERLQQITWPDAERYDQIRDRLQAVADGLTLWVSEDFGGLANNLNDWKGPAAENFSDAFYSHFPNVVESQLWLVTSLLAAAAVSKGAIRYSQHALMNTVTYTRELLREQLRLRRDAHRGGDVVRVFLTVAAAATSVLAAYFSGGLTTVVTVTLVGEAFAMAGAMLPDGAPTRTITGATAGELCDELVDSILEIERFLGTEYDNLHDELTRVTDLAQSPEVELTAVAPQLIDGVSGETFHHISSSYYRGTGS